MGRKSTWAAALALIIVGSAYWMTTSGDESLRPGTGAGMMQLVEPTTAVTPLVPYRPAQVRSLRLTLNGVMRAAQRTDQGWAVVAKPQFINDFLEDLTKLGALANLNVRDDELAEFGLAPAHALIQLEADSKSLFTLELGDRNPSTTGVYVRLPAENRVVLAGALLDWEFEKAFQSLATEVTPSPNP